jgi:hypothetical protein
MERICRREGTRVNKDGCCVKGVIYLLPQPKIFVLMEKFGFKPVSEFAERYHSVVSIEHG